MRKSVLFFHSQQILFEGLKPLLHPKLHTLIFHEPTYPAQIERLKTQGWKVASYANISNSEFASELKNRSLLIPYPEKQYRTLLTLLRKVNIRKVHTGLKLLIEAKEKSFKKDLEMRSSLALDASLERLRSDCSVLIDEEAYEDEELIMGGLCRAKPNLTTLSKPRPYSPKKQKLIFPYAQRIAASKSIQLKRALDAQATPSELLELKTPQWVGKRCTPVIDSVEFALSEEAKPLSSRLSDEEVKGKD